MGAGPVADHVDFMLDLPPANFVVAAYMAGDFSGNLTGRVDGLLYKALGAEESRKGADT